MSDLRHWLVLGKGDEDETFVVWSEEDAAAYGFAWERYRVDGPFVPEAEQLQAVNALREIARVGEHERSIETLKRIALEALNAG